MSNSAGEKKRIGRMALRAWKKHGDTVLVMTVVQVLARAVALFPLFLPALTESMLPAWLCALFAAALYIMLVLPLRCWGGEKLRRMFYTRNMPDREKTVYEKWLKVELQRYLRGILWGLPFLACVGYYYYGKQTLPYTKMWQPVMNLATLLGSEPTMDLGLPIAGALVLLFGVLFAYGWWRNVMVEYLPVRSIKSKQAFHWARRMRLHHGGEIRKVTFVNALLTVPAILGVAAVMIPYVLEKVDFSLSTDMIVQLVMRLLKAPLPARQLQLLGAVGVALYLPLCVFRKTRNAALAALLIQGENGDHRRERRVRHEHHEQNEAG